MISIICNSNPKIFIMNHRICNICYEYNDIQNKSTYNCPNPECFAYSCKSCLIKWFTDNNKCPICHVNVTLLEIEKLDDPIIIDEESVINESTSILQNLQKYNERCYGYRMILCYFISIPFIFAIILSIFKSL